MKQLKTFCNKSTVTYVTDSRGHKRQLSAIKRGNWVKINFNNNDDKDKLK